MSAPLSEADFERLVAAMRGAVNLALLDGLSQLGARLDKIEARLVEVERLQSGTWETTSRNELRAMNLETRMRELREAVIDLQPGKRKGGA